MKILVSQRIYFDKNTNEYRDCIDQKIIEWITKISCTPILVPNNLIKKSENYSKLISFIKKIKPRGLILTGGESQGIYKSRDKTEKYLIKYFLKKNYPIFGICRGMQIIASHFGSKLFKMSGHVRTRHDTIIKVKNGEFPNKVNSYHNLVVKKCPKNFITTVMIKDKTIEGIRHKKKRIEACMWHPEREKKFDHSDISRIKKFFHEKKN